MRAVAAHPFDMLAANYDRQWTDTAIGKAQRQAVWSVLDQIVVPGDSVLDLGCGTGEDELHLKQLGARVLGFDASPGMVARARAKGVTARTLRLERLDTVAGTYDGALSNFGALNCLSTLEVVSHPLTRLIRRGGFLALCLLGPCCAWETLYFASRFRFADATRRWRRGPVSTSLHIDIRYPALDAIVSAFAGGFRLVSWTGIGLFVPPSFVSLPEGMIAVLARLDRALAGVPGLRSFADHRLLIFERL